MSQLQVTGEAKIRDLQGPVVANAGVITALDGLPSQYVRGDGTLADVPSVTGGGASVSYYLNGSVNQGTFGGSTYYQMSKNAITGTGTNFSTSTNGLIAQFITDANDPDLTEIPSGNWNIEFYMGVSASSGSLASFYAELYKYDGTTFTLIASSVGTPELITNTTTVSSYFSSIAVPTTTLAETDRIAIRVYADVAGKTVTMYTEDNRLCQVVTTFSRGILSVNSLTDQQQYLTVGTAGTDFNIVSSVDTHTFNIPSASATNRGLITTGTQTIEGGKTFNSTATFNTGGVFNNWGISLYDGAGSTALSSSTLTGIFASKSGSLTDIVISHFLPYDSILRFSNDVANFTYTFPDITGTIALLEGTQTFTGLKTFGDSIQAGYGISLYNGIGTGALVSSTYTGFYAAKSGTYTNITFAHDGDPFFSRLKLLNNATYDYTFPALSGTLALLEGTQTFSGSKTFSNTIIFQDYALMNIGVALAKTSGTPLYASTNGYANLQLVNAGSVNSLYLNDGDTGKFTKLSFNNAADYTYTFPASSGTVALTSDLNAYVPYTGATQSVNLGTNVLTSYGLNVNQTGSNLSSVYFNNGGNAKWIVSNNGATGNFQIVDFVNSTTRLSIQPNNLLNLSGGVSVTEGLYVTDTLYLKLATTYAHAAGYYGIQVASNLFIINTSNTTQAVFGLGSLTTSRQYTLPDASGTLALTSNLSSYLPLVGGTLTGQLYVNTGGSDNQLALVGTAPSLRLTNAISGATINGFIAMSGAANNYIQGSVSGDMCIGNQNNGKILFGFGAGTATMKMAITSAGNVGIGTSSPFSVTNYTYLSLQGTTGSGLKFYNGSTAVAEIGADAGSLALQAQASNPILFLTGGSERMRITTSGQLGLGNTVSSWSSDWKALQMGSYGASVVGRTNDNSYFITKNVYFNGTDWVGVTTGWAQQMFFDNSGNTVFRSVSATANTATGFSEKLKIQSNGVVKIGNGVNPDDAQNPGYANVSISYNTSENAGFIQAIQQQINVYPLRLNASGGAVYAGGVRLDTLSDERMKKDISPLEDTLGIINQLKPKKFYLIDEKNGKLRYGFIAQELDGILDNFVYESDMNYKDDETGYEVKNIKGIENWASSWAALLVKAIQEQQAQIDELKALIATK